MAASQHLSLQPSQELQELSTVAHHDSCLSGSCLSGAVHSGSPPFLPQWELPLRSCLSLLPARGAVHSGETVFPASAYSFCETPLQELLLRNCPQWLHLFSMPPYPLAALQRWHSAKAVCDQDFPSLIYEPDTGKRG